MNTNNVDTININNYFPTLQMLNVICEKDSRLNPSSQLLFRLLAEQANRNRWTDTFVFTLDDIERITHMSRPTIIKARQQLKNYGYIDFKGKPSRYIVYSLVNRNPDQSSAPKPPVRIQKYNTKEKNEQKRKEEPHHDANRNDSHSNRTTLSEAAKAEVERCLSKLGY